MPRSKPPEPISPVAAALAKDRLGVPSVLFFVLAGVAPLTVAAGVIPTAFEVTGQTGVPAGFLIVAVVLAVFSAGYVAMARHISNAGAFYAFIARGLGRPAGVAAALVALASYNLLQVGLYGAFGAGFASYAADDFGIQLDWWVWALALWVVVTGLGQVRVDLSGVLLGVLLTAELLTVVALTINGLIHPANGRLSLATLSPTHLTTGGVGAVLAVAVTGYVGFEQSPVYAEEARNSRRTVPMATFLSLGLIAVVYASAALAMAVAYGDGNVVAVAGQQGSSMLFSLGSGILPHLGRTLFLTSVFAAALAFHNACWRYSFALGRERVLPEAFGRTGRAGVPKLASAVQSAFGFAVIIVYALAHWDPMVNLFFWLGTTGGAGILILLAVTSISVVCYFARHPHGEPYWIRVIAPSAAAVALLAMVWLCLDNYSTLLGVPAGSRAAKLLPAIFGVVAVIGYIWALLLKRRRPEVYLVIGLGVHAATRRAMPGTIVTTGTRGTVHPGGARAWADNAYDPDTEDQDDAATALVRRMTEELLRDRKPGPATAPARPNDPAAPAAAPKEEDR
ncbi:MAG TPA: APC family permease [Actinocrinis sp.]|nr:APC family permease [Actinocrinis sp.]